MRPFHLAFPVTNIDATIEFYQKNFQCALGRQAERWVDFNFYGHQLSFHLVETEQAWASNPVDGDDIRVPHFGIIMKKNDWQALHETLANNDVRFALEPKIRFKGQTGEQGTFFVLDPSNNILEFKYFDDDATIFARSE